MADQLIAYFSRAGENYFGGALKTVDVGNTELAANLLHELTGAELFRIEPIRAYSSSYNACIDEAQEDQRRDARPALKRYSDSLDGIDTVYLGYPNYWGTMPMPVFTFLEHYDLTGKVILPFCTHEGSGLGRSEADIRRLCPGALVEKSLAIRGSGVKNAGETLKSWLENRKGAREAFHV